MLAAGRARSSCGLRRSNRAAGGPAEALPFEDRSFDALTFTYLLRYVDDPRRR
jgi:ubiquinone/menaquinone biosynthesis C-methylase UbiE